MEDEDLYGAGHDDDADASTDAAPQEEQPLGEPVLVNKELCENCQPGDRLIVEVLKDHGKEMEIRYVGKEQSEESDMPSGDMPPEMAESGTGGGDSMMD